MKVVHINTNDGDDGVGRAAYRLHRGLQSLGVDSRMFVQRRFHPEGEVIGYRLPRTWRHRWLRRLRRWSMQRNASRYRLSRPQGYERFSDVHSLYQADFFSQLPNAQIYHLHSIAGFVDYPTFFGKLSNHSTIFWTLHDMEPFTGGCHYDFSCGRFAFGCGACPQLGSHKIKDLSHQFWLKKRDIYSQLPTQRLHLVALNGWMAEQALKSPIFNRFPVHIIPNGVEVDIFTPRPKKLARQVLGVPLEAHVLLYVAASMKTRRKGFHLLVEAMHMLQANRDYFLLSLGSGHPEIELRMPHLHLGSVSNDRLLSLIYSAADVLILPSLQDNQPNTILEAMSCGTPVIAFNVGGVSEVIQHGKNGILVSPISASGLCDAITRLLSDANMMRKISTNSRKCIVDDFNHVNSAKKLLEVYQNAVNRSNT